MNKIVVYSGNGCANCERVKSTLKSWNLEYEERNVSQHPEYLRELTGMGYLSIPVVSVGGRTFAGFRPDEIKAALGLESQGASISGRSD